MPIFTEASHRSPAGVARYVGAGAVIRLTDTPSDSASGGVALPTNPTGQDDIRTVNFADLIPDNTGVTVTYLGEVPTATFGFDIGSGDRMSYSRAGLAAMKIFVPNGVTLHIRYWWGTL